MKFYVTFGMQYAREAHPMFGSWAIHPDGWIEGEADNWTEARELTVAAFGQGFAFIYDEEDFQPAYHPMGSLGTLSKDGLTLHGQSGRFTARLLPTDQFGQPVYPAPVPEQAEQPERSPGVSDDYLAEFRAALAALKAAVESKGKGWTGAARDVLEKWTLLDEWLGDGAPPPVEWCVP